MGGLTQADGSNPSLYKKVDAKCCDAATWVAAGVLVSGVDYSQWAKSPEKGTGVYTCIPGDVGFLAPGMNTWVRGWQDCVGDKVAWAESCVPEEKGRAVAWPMAASVAAEHWEKESYEACHCHMPPVVGDACFVGLTFPSMAFFGKSVGDAFCAGLDSSEEVSLRTEGAVMVGESCSRCKKRCLDELTRRHRRDLLKLCI